MATPPAPATPQRERGYSNASMQGPSTWWDATSNEPTPELRWPLCIDIFENMTVQDAQVSSVLRAVTTPIERTGWRVDGSGCRPEVTAHVAGDFSLPIVGEGNDVAAVKSKGRFNWQDHLAIALEDYLTFGHSVFEQIYSQPDDQGLVHLNKLGYRPPRSIARFNVGKDGELDSIEQYGVLGSGSSSATIKLPANRLVVYVHGRKGGNWAGRSLLRPAYKFWILKDLLLRTQAQTIQRNGMGIPVYTGADGEISLDAGQEIATQIRAGDNAGTAIPYGAKIEMQGVSGTIPDASPVIRYYDEQIARAVLAHFLNLGTQTGSWALGSTFADFFTLSLQAVAEEIRNTATQQIVEDLVLVNYGPDEPAPRLVFDEIGSRRDAIVQAVASLLQAGALRPDEETEQFMRTAIGLPPYSGSMPFPSGPSTAPPTPNE